MTTEERKEKAKNTVNLIGKARDFTDDAMRRSLKDAYSNMQKAKEYLDKAIDEAMDLYLFPD